MVPEPEMFFFWKSAFPAFSTSPSSCPLSSAVSRARKWSYEAAPDFAPPYTGAICLSLFNVLKASSKAACDDAQQLMPFSTPSHTPRSDDNMQMRLRLRRYFPRFYIAVFGHSASLSRLHSMPHHLANFHRRLLISGHLYRLSSTPSCRKRSGSCYRGGFSGCLVLFCPFVFFHRF